VMADARTDPGDRCMCVAGPACGRPHRRDRRLDDADSSRGDGECARRKATARDVLVRADGVARRTHRRRFPLSTMTREAEGTTASCCRAFNSPLLVMR
jgi:hypothetical protein